MDTLPEPARGNHGAIDLDELAAQLWRDLDEDERIRILRTLWEGGDPSSTMLGPLLTPIENALRRLVIAKAAVR